MTTPKGTETPDNVVELGQWKEQRDAPVVTRDTAPDEERVLGFLFGVDAEPEKDEDDDTFADAVAWCQEKALALGACDEDDIDELLDDASWATVFAMCQLIRWRLDSLEDDR